jgi:ABC-type enterochelin transport system ATPase subunit
LRLTNLKITCFPTIMQRDYVAEYNRVIPIIIRAIRALDHYSDRLIVLANADEVKWNAGLKNDLLEIVLEIPKVIENIRVLF